MEDRDSIGLTPQGVVMISRLVEDLDWFEESQDAARLALAYAVQAGIGQGVARGTETRWTVGLFDRTNEIRATITALYPDCETPVRQMEFLVDEGLRLIRERLDAGALSPVDLLKVS
jgi:hypothetical protein